MKKLVYISILLAYAILGQDVNGEEASLRALSTFLITYDGAQPQQQADMNRYEAHTSSTYCVNCISEPCNKTVGVWCPTREEKRGLFEAVLCGAALVGCGFLCTGAYVSLVPPTETACGVNMMIAGGVSECGPIAGCIGLNLTEE